MIDRPSLTFRILPRPHLRASCPRWRREAHELGHRLCWTAATIAPAGGLLATVHLLAGLAVIVAACVLLGPAAFLLALPRGGQR